MGERLNPSNAEVVQLTPNEWEILRDLKLFSLTEEPIAFENPVEGTKKYTERTEEEWKHILSGGMSGWRTGETIMFFARVGDEYVGMVSSIIPDAEEEKDKVAIIQHMYVKRDHRGRGIGRDLITSLLGGLRTRGDLARVELEVIVKQTPAIGLYESVGFVRTGEPKEIDGRTKKPLVEIKMELVFGLKWNPLKPGKEWWRKFVDENNPSQFWKGVRNNTIPSSKLRKYILADETLGSRRGDTYRAAKTLLDLREQGLIPEPNEENELVE